MASKKPQKRNSINAKPSKPKKETPKPSKPKKETPKPSKPKKETPKPSKPKKESPKPNKTEKEKINHAKKKQLQKPKPKKPVGRALPKRAGNKKTSTKPRATKTAKKVAGKTTRRLSVTRYTRKRIRTPRKYAAKSRSFTIRKRTQKFTPALKPTSTNIKKLAKKARAYTKKSRAKSYIKIKLKDKRTKSEKWISAPRENLITDWEIEETFNNFYNQIDSGIYGQDLSISVLEVEQND